MNRRHRGVLCDRAQAWAALAPDGELSELEHKLLDAHLARCHACEAFAADVVSVADALRAEPLQTLSHPLTIPTWRRSGSFARLRTVGAAAAVALMAIGITARAPLPSDDRDTTPLPRVTDFSIDAQGELAQILRGQGSGLGDAGLQPGRQGLGQPL
jgi:hypothetical protein